MVYLNPHFLDKHSRNSSIFAGASHFFGSTKQIEKLIQTAISSPQETHSIRQKKTAYYFKFSFVIGQRNQNLCKIIKVITKRRNHFLTAVVVTDQELEHFRLFEAIEVIL